MVSRTRSLRRGALLGDPSGSEPVPGKRDHATPVNPLAPAKTIQPRDADAVAAVDHFMKSGDILSARILLKRAARTGDAQATLELGMTFDPIVLAERGVRGFASDVAQARAWYERAMALGSTEAVAQPATFGGHGAVTLFRLNGSRALKSKSWAIAIGPKPRSGTTSCWSKGRGIPLSAG